MLPPSWFTNFLHEYHEIPLALHILTRVIFRSYTYIRNKRDFSGTEEERLKYAWYLIEVRSMHAGRHCTITREVLMSKTRKRTRPTRIHWRKAAGFYFCDVITMRRRRRFRSNWRADRTRARPDAVGIKEVQIHRIRDWQRSRDGIKLTRVCEHVRTNLEACFLDQ